MRRISLFTMVIGCLWITGAMAQAPADCRKISNASKRLACFDRQSQEKEAAAANAAKQQQAEESARTSAALQGVLKSVRKLQARVAVGVSYREYFEPLAEAKMEVEQFARSSQAVSAPEVARHLTTAMRHYEMAGSVWQVKFAGKQMRDDLVLTQDLMQMYPRAPSQARQLSGMSIIPYTTMLSIIWAEARAELELAELAAQTLTSDKPVSLGT